MQQVLQRFTLTALALFPALALAQVPAAFTTAVTDATADGAAMAGALIGIAAAIVVVMIGVKFVKRIRGAV